MYDIEELAYSQRNWLKNFTRDIRHELIEQKEHKEEFWFEFPKTHWSPKCLGKLVTEVSKAVSIEVQFRHRELREYLADKCLKIYNSLTRHEAFRKLSFWFNTFVTNLAKSFLGGIVSGQLVWIFDGSSRTMKAVLLSAVGGSLFFILERLHEIFRYGGSLSQIVQTAKQYLQSLTDWAIARLLVTNRKDIVLFKFSPA